MKFFAIGLALVLALGSTTASAFEGGWYYDNNQGGSEILDLGDNTDNSYLRLYGTRGWCGRPGDSYATMRNTIYSNTGASGQVSWWVDADCGSAIRVCVEGGWGQVACSTYRVGEWWFD